MRTCYIAIIILCHAIPLLQFHIYETAVKELHGIIQATEGEVAHLEKKN